MHSFSFFVAIAASILSLTSAVTISEINGNKFLSTYAGQTLSGLQGLVTAKGSAGFYLRSTNPDTDVRTSESIYVFGSSSVQNVDVGDIITLTATVSEYRSSSDYIYLTELASATNIVKLSTGNPVVPIVLGSTIFNSPPTEYYSSLDTVDSYGYDVLAVPNNVSQISKANPTLDPTRFGLDFWESLSGELVTLKSPRALGRPNNYRETWVVGNYPTSGSNARGGLTMTAGDSNPEAIIVGSPLDGTRNPTTTKLGDNLADITGVIQQQFGYYYIIPLTNIAIVSSQSPDTPPPTTLISNGRCDQITFGDYNVDNLLPTSTAVTTIANQIANYLKTPTIVFLQEITDNSGTTDNGVVSSTTTLNNLVGRIYTASGVQYNYTVIDPVNDMDGGAPGYNIRVAYLYDPSVVQLHKANPGGSTDANQVLPGPELLYNPGRIDPSNDAWTVTRKPLAAAWETLDGKNKFFTVNVHWSSKGGGTTVESDERPPINGVVDRRTKQAQVTGDFIAQILGYDPAAKIVVAGDFNEFTFVKPLKTFLSVSGLQNLDDAALIPQTERYTYLYEMNSQELDHVFVSNSVALAAPEFEHIHLNTWSAAGAISDHDPSVARLNMCAPPTVNTTSSSSITSTITSTISSSIMTSTTSRRCSRTRTANSTTSSFASTTTAASNLTTSSTISSPTRATNSTSSLSSLTSTLLSTTTSRNFNSTTSSITFSTTQATNSTSSLSSVISTLVSSTTTSRNVNSTSSTTMPSSTPSSSTSILTSTTGFGNSTSAIISSTSSSILPSSTSIVISTTASRNSSSASISSTSSSTLPSSTSALISTTGFGNSTSAIASSTSSSTLPSSSSLLTSATSPGNSSSTIMSSTSFSSTSISTPQTSSTSLIVPSSSTASSSSQSSSSSLGSSSSVLYPNTTMTTSSRSSTVSGISSSSLTLSASTTLLSSTTSSRLSTVFDPSSASLTLSASASLLSSTTSSASSVFSSSLLSGSFTGIAASSTSSRSTASSYYDPGTSKQTSASGSSSSGGFPSSKVSSSGTVTSISVTGSSISSATSSVKIGTSAAVSTASMITSVVYTTKISTVTACPSSITNCPLKSTYITTSTIALYTTICPASPILIPTSKTSSIPGVPMTTSVVYITKIQTITACPSTAAHCPAQSTFVVTSTIPLHTTIYPITTIPIQPSSSNASPSSAAKTAALSNAAASSAKGSDTNIKVSAVSIPSSRGGVSSTATTSTVSKASTSILTSSAPSTSATRTTTAGIATFTGGSGKLAVNGLLSCMSAVIALFALL